MKEICLLLDNQHFDLVTNTRGFLMSRNFCATCEKPFSNKDQHLCEGTFPSCYRSNDQCQVVAVHKCNDCLRDFRNDQCFQLHKTIRQKRGKSFCNEVFICKKCKKFVSLLRRKNTAVHVCGEIFCKVCQNFVKQADHMCSIQADSPFWRTKVHFLRLRDFC